MLRAPHPVEPVEVEIVPVAPEPVPLAVAIVEEPAPTPVAPAASAAPREIRSRRPEAAVETAGATTGSGAEPAAPSGPSEPPGPRSKLMTMRGPRLEHGLSQQFIEDLNARAKPLPPPTEISGELAPSGGGTYRSDQGTFRVDVDRDGAAHITDSANLHVHVAVPRPRDIGNALAKWSEDPYRDPESAGRQRTGDYRTIGEDAKPSSPNAVPVPLVGGGFDVTDALMRRHGQDPYASKKLRVLDATRDERAEIGAKYRRAQLVQAAQLIKAAADRVWASGLDVAAKKRALFELWDDCADDGAAELVEAGGRARAFVIGFVNAKLPAGGATAFTADELAALNAHRRSRAVFAPYGP